MEGEGIPETGPSLPSDDQLVHDAMREGLSPVEQAELEKAKGIAQGMIGNEPAEYSPKVSEVLHDGEYDDDDSEFGEPDGPGVTDVDGTLDDSDVHPYVVTLTFFGAARPIEQQQLYDVIEQVIRNAEGRGLFHFHSTMGQMDMKHVAPGTPLHQAVTGQH